MTETVRLGGVDIPIPSACWIEALCAARSASEAKKTGDWTWSAVDCSSSTLLALSCAVVESS